jgi:hypothetical protein
MNAEELRAMRGRLTLPLMSLSGDALGRLNRVPYLSLGVDPRQWERWTGVQMMKGRD